MLQLKKIVKDYATGDITVHALKGISVNFRPNEFVSILGQSGCGKTTLLNIVGGLDQYTSGDLVIKGKSTKEYKDRDWDAYRNHSIGFVFQSYNLIMHQTVLQNVELALTLSGVSKAERRRRAKEVLERVGLGNQLNKKPNQMSGGQMQRVAIARALINNPEILLADEPTGALDTETSVQIMELLKEIAKDRLVIMVTHNPELAEQYSTRIIRLLDGEIKDDSAPYSDEEATKENEEYIKAAEKLSAKEAKKNAKLNRMSYTTALGLSFKNLLTKKGRTILTSFAGSIGIIGIALILSLSDGFRKYIKNVEEDTLSTYPLQITDESVDMNSLMMSMMGKSPDSGVEHDLDKIYSNNMVGDNIRTMLGEVKINDMISFRDYIEEGEGHDMYDYASDIMYTYGITINAYKDAPDEELYRVNPSTVFDNIGFGTMAEMSNLGMASQSATSVWSQMISNDELLHNQYDLVAGEWPSSYDEVVLVVTKNNEITDYELYSLGIRDISELQQIMAASFKGEVVNFDNTSYTYDELLALTFKVLPSSSYYKYNDEDGTFTDMSDDDEFVKQQLEKEGVTIKISGIVRASENATVHSITTPIGYTKELVDYLIDMAKNSEVGKAQLENPEINVLTGYEFGADIEEESLKEKEQESQEFLAAMGLVGKTDEEIAEYMSQLPPEQLQQVMLAMMESSEKESSGLSLSELKDMADATLEDNLIAMGVAYENDPKIISIYPVDFESKEKIIEIIDNYNDMVKAAGEDEKEITYQDMVGTMMSSVSTIINAISYVLMAFVAISLVVSSIMIGIITYISVLERTKEIGVLRSIGASKKDVSRVFNAETMIIGFTAGMMGIIVTILLNFPINAIIKAVAGLENIAKLPAAGAVILVIISVVLTTIGGLIPSRYAAKKDPVEALRSE